MNPTSNHHSHCPKLFPPSRLFLKAELQKSRSEQQAAAQAAGKRNQISFTPSSKLLGKEKEKEDGTVLGRQSRFRPYTVESRSGGRAAYS